LTRDRDGRERRSSVTCWRRSERSSKSGTSGFAPSAIETRWEFPLEGLVGESTAVWGNRRAGAGWSPGIGFASPGEAERGRALLSQAICGKGQVITEVARPNVLGLTGWPTYGRRHTTDSHKEANATDSYGGRWRGVVNWLVAVQAC
jgi:hypothetical protein